MEAGRSVPQHYELAILYPRSKVLQSYIIDYFIVVVQICRRFHAYTRKSVLSKIVSSLNDADIKEYQSKLVSWSKSIGEEINSLVAHTTEEEAQKNSRFRALMTKSSKATSQQQKVQLYQRILNQCSQYDYETTWRQLRKIGTTTIYSKAPEYHKWKYEWAPVSKYSALLFSGKLGSGKSVMMANIVDDLFIQCKLEVATVAYYFCRHDLPESLKARTVMGALVRQIVRPFFNAFEDMDFINDLAMGFSAMFLLMENVLPNTHKVYVVLDGLDLCDRTEQQTVFEQLRKLQLYFAVFPCITLRLGPDSKLASVSEHIYAAKVVSLPDNTPDIETFIHAELTRCLECGSLTIGNPRLILDIHETLSKESKGMFLWVDLQIKSLCTMRTDEEITVALGDLPKDLSEIYDRILQQSSEPGKPYQKRILEILTAAQRPLTVDELREAVSVSPGDTVWTAAKLVNDIYATMASCGCLLVVEEEERTVRFMHPSVEQYLYNRYKDSRDSSITVEGCHRTMAEIIVTYLNYGVFGTEVSTFRVPKVNVGSTPAMVIQSTTAFSKSTQSLALKLLKLRKQPDFDVGRTLAEELRSNQNPIEQKFHFHDYAQQWCPLHVSETFQLEPHVTRLLPTVLERRASTARYLSSFAESYVMGALERHNVALMKVLLGTVIGQWAINEVLPSTVGRGTYSAFHYAVCSGSEAMVQLFLDHSKGKGPYLTHKGGNICSDAFLGNEQRIERHIQVEYRDSLLRHICMSGGSPLTCAIWGGSHGVIKLLLQSEKIDVNAGELERTAIWEAVKRGDRIALGMLLASEKVQLDDYGIEKLMKLAKEKGDQEIFMTLTNVYAHHPSGRSAPIPETQMLRPSTNLVGFLAPGHSTHRIREHQVA